MSEYAGVIDGTRSDALIRGLGNNATPADVAFITMSLYQLGRRDEAGEALRRLRHVTEGLIEAYIDGDARSFLQEAEALLAPATQPAPTSQPQGKGGPSSRPAESRLGGR